MRSENRFLNQISRLRNLKEKSEEQSEKGITMKRDHHGKGSSRMRIIKKGITIQAHLEYIYQSEFGNTSLVLRYLEGRRRL